LGFTATGPPTGITGAAMAGVAIACCELGWTTTAFPSGVVITIQANLASGNRQQSLWLPNGRHLELQ